MKILVIGYGSIGIRHARVLKGLSQDVSVVSRRDIDFKPSYKSLTDAFKKERFDYVVIANETSKHFETLSELNKIGFRGIALVEKPLFSNVESIQKYDFEAVFVAYNLRFHPIIQKLNEILKNEKILSVQAYVGKYLPEWRPTTNYKAGYSAKQSEGGGVLRDLSHELDYLNWILGGWETVTALGGHLSHLEIDSDDVFSLMFTTLKCPIVTVQMNYLDRISQREILINTDRHTYKADLIKGTLQIDGNLESFKVDQDSTYKEEHSAIINHKFDQLCSFEEGIDVLKMIEAAEQAAQEQIWISKVEVGK